MPAQRKNSSFNEYQIDEYRRLLRLRSGGLDPDFISSGSELDPGPEFPGFTEEEIRLAKLDNLIK